MADEVGIESDLDVAFSVAATFVNHGLELEVAGGFWNPASHSWDA
jgi:hypothetical protein